MVFFLFVFSVSDLLCVNVASCRYPTLSLGAGRCSWPCMTLTVSPNMMLSEPWRYRWALLISAGLCKIGGIYRRQRRRWCAQAKHMRCSVKCTLLWSCYKFVFSVSVCVCVAVCVFSCRHIRVRSLEMCACLLGMCPPQESLRWSF